ncbi:plasmalemma vesicle associated protein a isoform X2 [Nerophis ophidion]|uniref:plasmalemma vesicle associated protein a isoform X2 n=1 Tax=Nerophis ophidion TaxID=159077 RepID=UPI002AE07F0B|nr:plasmalemma vesicle associated protein a isoform X2 [Nerophis ophidion]
MLVLNPNKGPIGWREIRKSSYEQQRALSSGRSPDVAYGLNSLIIVSLVLFLVYGKTQDSPSTARIQDLEESFSRLSIENVALRHLRRNLTNLLNVTLTEKTRIEMDLGVVRRISNISFGLIQDLNRQQQQTNSELFMCKNQPRTSQPFQPMTPRMSQPISCNCGQRDEELRAKLKLVESNFTQTTERMRMDLDQIAKDRDNLNLEAIRLRRDKSVHEKEIEFSRQRCKEDFVQSLSGVSNVSRAFLQKIESLFPSHIAFQLTCLKQREHLEQIRSNCTSLSREVEDRFQYYLNTVGDQVSEIQTENSHLKAENMRLFDDFRTCSLNRTGLIQEHRQNREKLQLKHDRDYETLLLEKRRLHGDIEVLENNVNYKNKEVQHLAEQLKQLNLSCMPKTGLGSGIGSRFPSPGLGLNKPGLGSTGLGFNTLESTRQGSSSLGSTGSGLNKLGLNGQGSSSLGSTGSGLNKLGLNGQGSSSLGSTGSGLNKLGLIGQGSSSLGSTGSGLNKLGLNGQGSSSLGSTGSGLNKLGLNGQGSSNPGSTGSGLNRQVSTGLGSSSFGSTGSGLGKQGSTGLGSSGVGLTLPGLKSQGSTGLGKQGSTGLGSSGLGLTLPGLKSQGSTGLGSTSFGSTGSGLGKQGSTGLGSSGLGLTLPGLNSQGSTGLGSSSRGSTGSGLTGLGTSSLGSAGSNPSFGSSGASANKPTSNLNTLLGLGSTSKSGSSNSGFPWFGSSNTGQNKPGSGIGRGTSSGFSLGTGRTSSLGGGSVSIAQHLQDLQRIINPSYSSEEKQDLSRMLG